METRLRWRLRDFKDQHEESAQPGKILAIFAIEVRRGDFPDQSWRRRSFREQVKIARLLRPRWS